MKKAVLDQNILKNTENICMTKNGARRRLRNICGMSHISINICRRRIK